MFILKCFLADLTETGLKIAHHSPACSTLGMALSPWPWPELQEWIKTYVKNKCGWYILWLPTIKKHHAICTEIFIHIYILYVYIVYIYMCVCVVDDIVSKHAISTAIFLSKKSGISRALSPCPARHPSPALASGPGCISPSSQEESHGGFNSMDV